jgi:antitoxin component YwqK of YwqJK toxin-antitoxin module
VKRININDLAYPGDGLYYDGEKPFTGTAFYLSDVNGSLECEEEFRDGLMWGGRRAWHPSGVLEEEAQLAYGVYHGRVRTWHENGRPASEEVYEHGIRLEGKCWDESGKLTEDFRIAEDNPQLQMYRKALGTLEHPKPDPDAPPPPG